MQLLTAAIRARLLANGRQQAATNPDADDIDFAPVVRLFNPCGAATWLLTELDPDEPDIAFGLCDLGMGTPELGTVRISELESYRGRLGLGIERDMHWTPRGTLRDYARAAWEAGCIVEPREREGAR